MKQQIEIYEPSVIEIVGPVRFEAVLRSDMNILVNRRDIANIAGALCMATRDAAERRGIIQLAQALGVEVR